MAFHFDNIFAKKAVSPSKAEEMNSNPEPNTAEENPVDGTQEGTDEGKNLENNNENKEGKTETSESENGAESKEEIPVFEIGGGMSKKLMRLTSRAMSGSPLELQEALVDFKGSLEHLKTKGNKFKASEESCDVLRGLEKAIKGCQNNSSLGMRRYVMAQEIMIAQQEFGRFLE
jgi:hypothetical protein